MATNNLRKKSLDNLITIHKFGGLSDDDYYCLYNDITYLLDEIERLRELSDYFKSEYNQALVRSRAK